MNETLMLTTVFLAVTTPLYIAVGIIGADRVRASRHDAALRRTAAR